MHSLVHKHKQFHSAVTFLLFVFYSFPPYFIYVFSASSNSPSLTSTNPFPATSSRITGGTKTDWLKREENQWNRQQLWSEWWGWGGNKDINKTHQKAQNRSYEPSFLENNMLLFGCGQGSFSLSTHMENDSFQPTKEEMRKDTSTNQD